MVTSAHSAEFLKHNRSRTSGGRILIEMEGESVERTHCVEISRKSASTGNDSPEDKVETPGATEENADQDAAPSPLPVEPLALSPTDGAVNSSGDPYPEASPSESPPPEETPETPENEPPHVITANGDMNSSSSHTQEAAPPTTPTTEQRSKQSKLSVFSRIFKPWKWKRRKKPSEKIQKTAIDLERKISVRTSREELIKRGVLKEVDESTLSHRKNSDSDDDSDNEAKKEAKAEALQNASNGGATPVPGGASPRDSPRSVPSSMCGAGTNGGESLLRSPNLSGVPDHTISLSPQHQSQGSPRLVCGHGDMKAGQQIRLPPPYGSAGSPHIHQRLHSSSSGDDQLQRPESMVVQPQHIRVMLPVEERDRQKPIIQKTQSSTHHIETHFEAGPNSSSTTIISQQSAVASPPPTAMTSPNVPPGTLFYPTPSLQHQHHRSAAYSNQTYSTMCPKGSSPMAHPSMHHAGCTTLPSNSSSVPKTAFSVGSRDPQKAADEVVIHEPDLNKRPTRSALKGAKSKELLQRQLQARLQHRHNDSDSSSGVRFGGHGGPPPKIAPKPRVFLQPRNVVMDNKENHYGDEYPDYDNLHSDDSDEEIHYRDSNFESILAAKVHRQDSLARFLSQRPNRRELIDRNILPLPENDRIEKKMSINNKLNRRLSLRPTAEELQEKHILLRQSDEEFQRQKEETKKILIRKLSFRPTIEELKERKIIKFSDYVEVTNAPEFDRKADKPWTRLTPRDKASIRKELNDFKSTEMDVHDDSRHLTRFHRP